MKKGAQRRRGLSRRSFVKLLPAAGLGAPGLGQQPQTPPAPQRVTREALRCAEQLIGFDLTEAQEEMAHG